MAVVKPGPKQDHLPAKVEEPAQAPSPPLGKRVPLLPPEGLGVEERRLWRLIKSDYDFPASARAQLTLLVAALVDWAEARKEARDNGRVKQASHADEESTVLSGYHRAEKDLADRVMRLCKDLSLPGDTVSQIQVQAIEVVAARTSDFVPKRLRDNGEEG